MRRRAVLTGLPLALAACAPVTQRALAAPAGFGGPAFVGDRFVSFDGASLGLSTWAPEGEPWAVIVGLHGMDDYANAFHMAAPFWAKQGIATYAYDQRGFGRRQTARQCHVEAEFLQHIGIAPANQHLILLGAELRPAPARQFRLVRRHAKRVELRNATIGQRLQGRAGASAHGIRRS